MLNLEEMADRRITGANYITSVNGMGPIIGQRVVQHNLDKGDGKLV